MPEKEPVKYRTNARCHVCGEDKKALYKMPKGKGTWDKWECEKHTSYFND